MSENKLSEQERTIKNQEICQRLIDREVIHCCSLMVTEMLRSEMAEESVWYDDLMAVTSKYDYRTPIEESEHLEIYEDEYGAECVRDMTDGTTWAVDDDWQETAEHFDIEPHLIESYEHWIVSKWFADQLESEGEMVAQIFDFQVWGRTTTGQSISIDGVTERIASSMEILCGQRNDWSRN